MYKSFDLLKTLSFVRTGGSIEEKNAADILLSECNKLGAKAWLEEFLVDGYDMHEAKLSFSDSDINIECCGVGMSSSTLDEGVTGPFKYVTSLNDAIINNIEGCICLVHSKLVNYKLYKKLVEKKVSGLILCCGDIYLDNDMVDLESLYLDVKKQYYTCVTKMLNVEKFGVLKEKIKYRFFQTFLQKALFIARFLRYNEGRMYLSPILT